MRHRGKLVENQTLNIVCTTKIQCSIPWEVFTPADGYPIYFTGDLWSVCRNREDNCWTLWKGTDKVFESVNVSLVFMVSREVIVENLSNGFIPSWEE